MSLTRSPCGHVTPGLRLHCLRIGGLAVLAVKAPQHERVHLIIIRSKSIVFPSRFIAANHSLLE